MKVHEVSLNEKPEPDTDNETQPVFGTVAGFTVMDGVDELAEEVEEMALNEVVLDVRVVT